MYICLLLVYVYVYIHISLSIYIYIYIYVGRSRRLFAARVVYFIARFSLTHASATAQTDSPYRIALPNLLNERESEPPRQACITRCRPIASFSSYG